MACILIGTDFKSQETSATEISRELSSKKKP